MSMPAVSAATPVFHPPFILCRTKFTEVKKTARASVGPHVLRYIS